MLVESKDGHDTFELSKDEAKEETQKQLKEGKWVTVEKKDGGSELLTEKDLPEPKASEDEDWAKKFENVRSITATGKVKVVYVRYWDHVLFKDVDPRAYGPQVRETVGWLAEDNGDYIRIEWERFVDEHGGTKHRVEPRNIKQRATGLVILKSCILELREVG